MAKITIIRFDLNRPDGYDVNRLPEGVKGDPQLMMWKELCRSGIYETGGVKHNIDRAFLQNIVDTFWERNAKGIEVPCPVGHTHDPEAKRGKVVYVELREGKDGSVSLYGIIEFVDFGAKKSLCNSGVSIEAPEVVTDGDGETHKFGLEHVAFTDYPVVAGMEGFRDVVFSIFKTLEKMGMRKKFSEMTSFDECPNCGHELDEDVGQDDVVQSRRYGRRFADDVPTEDVGFDDEMLDEDGALEDGVVQSRRYGRRCGRRFADEVQYEEDPAEISQSRRYGRRCGRRFADDATFDDDPVSITQSRRYGRRFADELPEDEESAVVQSRRYGRRCGRRFADEIQCDDDPVAMDVDVVQSRRYGRRFADEIPNAADIAQSRRYGRRFADEDPLAMDVDVVQSRRYGRRFADEVQYDDTPIEEVSQSRRYGRRFADDVPPFALDEEVSQSRRYGRRFADEVPFGLDDEGITQSRRYSRRYSNRFADDDIGMDDDPQDIVQSRRYSRRFSDEDLGMDDDIGMDEESVDETISQARRYARRFSDDAPAEELPANALAVEQEKRYGNKQFSLRDADTVSANILKENRELQVQNLLSEGKINRIQANQILARFCNQRAISFSVNTGDNSEFKNVVELMRSGIGADYSEKTGVQFSVQEGNGTGNELLAAIEKRNSERK